MRDEVGVWLDHRQAVIVSVTGDGEEVERIASNVEKQLRRSGSSPPDRPYEALQVPADDSRERALTGHRNQYYDAIIGRIGDAQSILIMGPGEAKGELQKRMERAHLAGRIVGIETVDKMTERQILAKVRQRFATS